MHRKLRSGETLFDVICEVFPYLLIRLSCLKGFLNNEAKDNGILLHLLNELLGIAPWSTV